MCALARTLIGCVPFLQSFQKKITLLRFSLSNISYSCEAFTFSAKQPSQKRLDYNAVDMNK